jgi:hypothetical protein
VAHRDRLPIWQTIFPGEYRGFLAGGEKKGEMIDKIVPEFNLSSFFLDQAFWQ